MKISVMTASRNRGEYLNDIYNSLANVNNIEIEWLIADDCSSDLTEQIVTKIGNETKIKLCYIRAEKHIGKAVLENRMLDLASGDYIVSCDAGDYFVDNAFIRFQHIVENYNVNIDEDIISVVAMCTDKQNNRQTFKREKFNMPAIINWDRYFKYIRGDACILTKNSMVGNSRFPEVDFVVQESSLWRKLQYGKKLLILDEEWKIMKRDIPDSISFEKKMRYTKGWMLAITKSETSEYFKLRSLYEKIILVVNYYRYALHSDFKFSQANELWKITKYHKVYRPLMVIGLIAWAWDLLTKNCEKTYLEFENNKSGSITVKYFNYSKAI